MAPVLQIPPRVKVKPQQTCTPSHTTLLRKVISRISFPLPLGSWPRDMKELQHLRAHPVEPVSHQQWCSIILCPLQDIIPIRLLVYIRLHRMGIKCPPLIQRIRREIQASVWRLQRWRRLRERRDLGLESRRSRSRRKRRPQRPPIPRVQPLAGRWEGMIGTVMVMTIDLSLVSLVKHDSFPATVSPKIGV